jgi:hypothetical protein
MLPAVRDMKPGRLLRNPALWRAHGRRRRAQDKLLALYSDMGAPSRVSPAGARPASSRTRASSMLASVTLGHDKPA